MSTNPQATKQNESATIGWMDVVAEKVSNLRYGSVQITVHDGRVTLVESVERTRFNAEPTSPSKAR